MPAREGAARAYARQGDDPVRETFERELFAGMIPRLLAAAGGGELLDLGCRDGLAGRLAGGRLQRYLGIDLDPRLAGDPPAGDAGVLAHDLRDGLGAAGPRPFDLYLGTFGVASHLRPAVLRRLLAEIAAHARPGALVALEALGRYSLEWPRLWDAPVGAARTIPYRLAADVPVHPWSAHELFGLYEEAGVRPLYAVDRTLQAGPKTGPGRYWPGLPDVRRALNAALCGAPDAALHLLTAPLPPLPAGETALVHHTLAERRRALVRRWGTVGAATARAVWRLEPRTGAGFGHGLLAVGRVR